MNIGILRHEKIGYAENELVKIGRERGHNMRIIHPHVANIRIEDRPEVDAVISRAEINTFGNSITDAYFRVLNFYESWNIPIINGSRATLNAQDKFRTHVLVARAGLNTPKTIIGYGSEEIKKNIEAWTFPYVIKKPYGSRGEGVLFAHDREDLEEISDRFSEDEPFLIQEYIPLERNEEGNFRDMRLWVCRNSITERPEFLGGMYRNSTNGDFRTNISVGGKSEYMKEFPEDVSYMAEKSLDAIDADVAGIDIARSQEGEVYLIEINISFDSRIEIQSEIGISIEENILDLAEHRTEIQCTTNHIHSM